MKKIIIPFLAIAFVACNSDDDNSGSNAPNPPFAGNFASITANGVAVPMQEGPTYAQSFSNGSSVGAICSYDYGASFSNLENASAHPQILISFQDIYISAACDGMEDEVFSTLFETAAYPYSNGSNPGMLVIYTPAGAEPYISNLGSQTGSTFEVTEVTALESSSIFGTDLSMRVKGNFTCKVYNPDMPADVITIENGSFSFILDAL